MGDPAQKKSNPAPVDNLAEKAKHAYAVQPGLSQRLTQLFDDAQVPKSARIAYVCEETGRKKQTVHRWLLADNPGNPDLESFALLCLRFRVDANWFLGLTPTPFPLPDPVNEDATTANPVLHENSIAEYLFQINSELQRVAPGNLSMLMPGDEMEPRIRKGARLIVDPDVREMGSNGIYVLDYNGQRIVRTVEHRIGVGIVLACDNLRYQATVFKDTAAATKAGVSVIGEIKGWHQTTWV